ncbi:MAG: helix-turn-helix domain-containing protein [Paludibacteraceae bacterium]|nr:helix-turn-helix domain-containing protein [Paludibacteraceae bacterium]
MKHFYALCTFILFSLTMQAQNYSLRHYNESNGLSHHHTTRVLQDSTGMMWVATYNGLNRFDGYRFVTFKAEAEDEMNMPSDRIRRIRLTDDNNILCLIDDSVVLFNTHTCRFESLQASEEIKGQLQSDWNPDLWVPKDQYSSLGNLRFKDIRYDYEDRQGNRWLIDDHGLFVATPLPSRGTRVNTEEVRAMRQLANGAILASIRGAKQIAVYDPSLRLLGYIRPDGALSKNPASFDSQVYCFYESRDGKHAWIGCKPGCLLEGDNDSRTYSIWRHEQVRNVYDVIEDHDGNVWAATFGFGLWKSTDRSADRIQNTDRITFTQIPGTENMRMRRLLVLEDNTLLAATESGLLVIDGMSATGSLNDGMMKLHQREAGRPNSLNCSALMCLGLFNGQLYIGTEGGGINRLISEDIHAAQLEFEHITKADGLGSDIVYEFLPWSEDELMVQCNNALSILEIENGKLKIENYGKSFFRTAEDRPFNLGEVQPIDLGDGRILIAPHDGLRLLNKSDLVPETEPVRIAFSSISLEGKMNYAVDNLNHLTLAPNERSIGIQFAALDYRGTSDIRYQTRFYAKGEDIAPWSAPTEMSEVLMQDITPGEYVFEVRSTNALGQWQDNTRRLTITVTPTFWESTAGWVLQIGLLLLITIAITIQSMRVRYHRKQREATLNAYLELQERYLQISNDKSQITNESQEPLPIPEILIPGYTSENEKFLSTLHQFMEQNIDNAEMTIDDIADATHMSRSSLNRKMHELFNLSAKDFVQAARIKHACNLLRTTDMAAKEVAYACGFSDPRYFSKSFKANTGDTPTEYRGKCL